MILTPTLHLHAISSVLWPLLLCHFHFFSKRIVLLIDLLIIYYAIHSVLLFRFVCWKKSSVCVMKMEGKTSRKSIVFIDQKLSKILISFSRSRYVHQFVLFVALKFFKDINEISVFHHAKAQFKRFFLFWVFRFGTIINIKIPVIIQSQSTTLSFTQVKVNVIENIFFLQQKVKNLNNLFSLFKLLISSSTPMQQINHRPAFIKIFFHIFSCSSFITLKSYGNCFEEL